MSSVYSISQMCGIVWNPANTPIILFVPSPTEIFVVNEIVIRVERAVTTAPFGFGVAFTASAIAASVTGPTFVSNSQNTVVASTCAVILQTGTYPAAPSQYIRRAVPANSAPALACRFRFPRGLSIPLGEALGVWQTAAGIVLANDGTYSVEIEGDG